MLQLEVTRKILLLLFLACSINVPSSANAADNTSVSVTPTMSASATSTNASQCACPTGATGSASGMGSGGSGTMINSGSGGSGAVVGSGSGAVGGSGDAGGGSGSGDINMNSRSYSCVCRPPTSTIEVSRPTSAQTATSRLSSSSSSSSVSSSSPVTTTSTTTTSATTTSTTTTVSTTTAIKVTSTSTSTPTVGTGGSSGGSTAGIAAGLALGLGLPIIILTVIAVVVCYKLYIANPARRKIKRKSDSKQLLDEDYNANGSAVVDDVVKTETLVTKETAFDRPSFPPIALANLPAVVSDLHESNDLGFSKEYTFIKQNSPEFTQKHAYMDTNMEKNRYRNILPFDDTRVLLRIGGKDNHANYINANYIDGYSGRHTYIAAQGPLPNTMADFWQMVWEQKCEVIVMLTGLIEGGRRKCTQYWPDPQDGVLVYGGTEVTIISEKNFSSYIYRTMEIAQKHSTANATMKSDKRTIQHFAFTQWPDFGVPSNPQAMLRFVRTIRSRLPPHNVPILIHCSAGVGRSGTFITMDVMLQRIDEQQALNIKEFVLGMRHQRTHMVQTERQYIFLYDALLEAYLYGNTTVQAKNMKRYAWTLTQEKQDNGLTGLEEEFNNLPSCDYPEEVFTVALSEEHLRQNRDKLYIPFDFNRIVVGEQESYINAVGVRGYNDELSFIATQHPLVNTIAMFWTMVYEQNIKVIVMLGGLKNVKDSYWNSTRYPLVITKEEDKEYYTVTHITIHKPQEHSVIHYLFKAWTADRVAPMRKSILALLKEVRAANDPGCPIAIHSSTSLTKEGSGVYCALAICLESLNNEEYADVFQSVRSLREQRPYILYSKELYKFIYLCLVDFLQNHRNAAK